MYISLVTLGKRVTATRGRYKCPGSAIQSSLIGLHFMKWRTTQVRVFH